MEIKKSILNTLKNKPKSSTAISTELNEAYWKIVNLLMEMEKEGLVKREKKRYFTFWSLNKKEAQK